MLGGLPFTYFQMHELPNVHDLSGDSGLKDPFVT